MSSPDQVPSLPALPVGLYLAPGAAHRVLADLPPNRPASARRTRRRVGAGKVRIGDNRLGPFGQPLVGLDGLAPPFLLTAIPVEQADAGSETVSAPKVPTSCRCRWPLR